MHIGYNELLEKTEFVSINLQCFERYLDYYIQVLHRISLIVLVF